MDLEDRLPAFVVNATESGHDVANRDGLVYMSCRDVRSAEHYADLMNKAFTVGYKSGRRDARR